MVFVDLYTVLVFKDPPGPPPFYWIFWGWRSFKILTANLGNLFLATYAGGEGSEEKARLQLQLFFFSESEVLKEVVYIVTHGV